MIFPIIIYFYINNEQIKYYKKYANKSFEESFYYHMNTYPSDYEISEDDIDWAAKEISRVTL